MHCSALILQQVHGNECFRAVPLCQRQLRIVRMVAAGAQNQEIATQLGTTKGVIKNELCEIYDQLGFSRRVELALWFTKKEFDERVATV